MKRSVYKFPRDWIPKDNADYDGRDNDEPSARGEVPKPGVVEAGPERGRVTIKTNSSEDKGYDSQNLRRIQRNK